MSTGWSIWVMGLVVFNLGITLFLFIWGSRVSIPTEPDNTSGHIWAHGVLREGVRKLPTWWTLMSIALFIAAFVYLMLFPGFGNHPGTLNWTSSGQLEDEVAQNAMLRQPLLEFVTTGDYATLTKDKETIHAGQRLFFDNCAACHGREATGNQLVGAPNLVDRGSLYGNSAADIEKTIREGRTGAMPPLASLGEETVYNLAHYVRSISGNTFDAAAADLGEKSFAFCGACHGPDAKGNPMLGAPDLTDNAWLYGDSLDAITTTINNGRQGFMPAWKGRLADTDIRFITAWILSQQSWGNSTGNISSDATTD